MADQPSIKIVKKDDSLNVYVPLTSQGKFRCKIRDNFQEYGTGFAPKSTLIPSNAYVEWQIGYDRLLNDEKKTTSLGNLKFIGANGKNKNPYELSEIMYMMCELGCFSSSELDRLISTINNMNEFLQETFQIQTKIESNVSINDEDFFKSVITLPTFNKKNDSCGVITEITISKQQYATGVQPMLYTIIPVVEFTNSNDIIGHTSAETKYGILKLNSTNKDIIENIFICFGMCSASHHHDVIEILKLIKDAIFN